MQPHCAQEKVPPYLQPYVVAQNYERYTPREQATWRFIMRNAREFFTKCAHPVYVEGLRKTGIPIHEIPRIEEIDRVLSAFGWGAVCVRGFIPPLAFLDFQSRKILPIAADMRTLAHVCYTSAPDIVHEAAGHAPILADSEYASYLTQYAMLAKKAIFSAEDVRVYEAIRKLSDFKENPDCSPEDIQQAQEELEAANRSVSWVSEAAKVARMNWWTAEYGLIGTLASPKIFGAGLLSSLSESKSCLEEGVRKIPLSLACTEQSYDITEPQPQLFVTRDFAQLIEVLKELEATMSFQRGGEHGLSTAQKSGTVTTVQWDSGVAVSGVLDLYRQQEGRVAYVRWRGAVQICEGDRQLSGQGCQQHPNGFSSPVGAWLNIKVAPHLLTDSDLMEMGLRQGERCTLLFASGICVIGTLHHWVRNSMGGLLLLSWRDTEVVWKQERLFHPDWGDFDMLVGSEAFSVYGGPADWGSYGGFDLGAASSSPGRSRPYTESEQRMFILYQQVREYRESAKPLTADQIRSLEAQICVECPQEWLLRLELLELAATQCQDSCDVAELRQRVEGAQSRHPELSLFIQQSLQMLTKPD